ncbi:MAG: hypothetical protein HC831_06520 [Chloroflexia bacterium]|nr:hypothetical protein [Chloroflexia bacterium]
MASSNFSQLILSTGLSINTPTKTSAGAVATDGTIDSTGEMNMKGKNSNPAITAVNHTNLRRFFDVFQAPYCPKNCCLKER